MPLAVLPLVTVTTLAFAKVVLSHHSGRGTDEAVPSTVREEHLVGAGHEDVLTKVPFSSHRSR